MSVEIKIPAVGESINTGTIAQWHKSDGEFVKAGEIVLTLETDKISTEIEAPASGTLKTQAAEGDEVAIGSTVASIEEGSAPAGSEASEPAKSSDAAPVETAEAKAKPKVSVSPTVKAFAEEKNVDLSKVKGTGKKGALTKADIKAYIEKEGASSASASTADSSTKGLAVVPAPASEEKTELVEPVTSSGDGEAEGRFTRTKMSPLRRKIATHLVNAQQTAAILTTFNECDMTEVMKLRKSVQENFVAKHGVKLGFMSFFIKAVVDGLKLCPLINSRVEENDMIVNHFYDIGVAVGTEKGLFVPVIRDCDQKSFAQIEKDIIGYAMAAKDGKIQFSDLQGGVFTISNGGVYGSLLSTPILNPPQSGILGMHTIQQRPVAVDGKVEIRPMMYLALSYDHRIVDGKEAVQFLIRVKECIENPTRLLVGA